MDRSKLSLPNKLDAGLTTLAAALVAASLCVAPADAKRVALQMPAYEKLDAGAGPETNDLPDRPAGGKIPLKLPPVTLGGQESTGDSGTSEPGPFLKTTVTATGFAPKGPVDPASKSLFQPKEKISGLGSDGILQQARHVNVMPLPLMETQEETQAKVDTMLEAEKAQLSNLWESTLTRSPDVQFVIQKLMPTSNPGHASTIMMRMLSSAIFGAMGTVNMMSPSMGTYATTGIGANLISSVLGMQESKVAQKARLSQTESIMLYNMVRHTADRLVENYRNYKKQTTALNKAAEDLQDLQNMVTEARGGQDAAKQVEMEYTIRKAQRDIESITDDVRKFRQALIDLAGQDAVAKLDQQLEEEQARLDRVNPDGSTVTPQTAAAPGTQS